MISKPETRASRFGNQRCGLTNLACSKVCHEKKEKKVSRNVQIEINEAVREKAEAGDKGRKLECGSKSSVGLRQAPERIEKQNTQEPKAAQATRNTSFCKGLEIIVMSVIDDLSVIESFISGKDNLESRRGRCPSRDGPGKSATCRLSWTRVFRR